MSRQEEYHATEDNLCPLPKFYNSYEQYSRKEKERSSNYQTHKRHTTPHVSCIKYINRPTPDAIHLREFREVSDVAVCNNCPFILDARLSPRRPTTLKYYLHLIAMVKNPYSQSGFRACQKRPE
jgi:hypothetical protein